MKPPSHCQRCGAAPTESGLSYKRGQETAAYPSLLQCDVCERSACSNCLEIFDILSGHDFLCADCALQFPPQPRPQAPASVSKSPRKRAGKDKRSPL